jgi:hypothetical protein
VSDPLSGPFGAVDPAASPWPRIRVLILPPFDGSSEPPAVFDGMLGLVGLPLRG